VWRLGGRNPARRGSHLPAPRSSVRHDARDRADSNAARGTPATPLLGLERDLVEGRLRLFVPDWRGTEQSLRGLARTVFAILANEAATAQERLGERGDSGRQIQLDQARELFRDRLHLPRVQLTAGRRQDR
jgi:hypothetical protein